MKHLSCLCMIALASMVSCAKNEIQQDIYSPSVTDKQKPSAIYLNWLASKSRDTILNNKIESIPWEIYKGYYMTWIRDKENISKAYSIYSGDCGSMFIFVGNGAYEMWSFDVSRSWKSLECMEHVRLNKDNSAVWFSDSRLGGLFEMANDKSNNSIALELRCMITECLIETSKK